MWEWMDHAIGVSLNRVASMDEMVMHRPPAFSLAIDLEFGNRMGWSIYLEA